MTKPMTKPMNEPSHERICRVWISSSVALALHFQSWAGIGPVAWGKATTFVVGGRGEQMCDWTFDSSSEAPKRWETISCKSIFLKKPLHPVCRK